MDKNIQLQERNIHYKLKVSKRARRMRLAVYCDGSFTVTTPRYVDLGIIERFIIQKSQWVLDRINYFKNSQHIFLPKSTRTNYLQNKESARQFAKQKVEHFNKIYNYKFNNICIKNQKTRWGSCSSKGNLNFNYKIAFLPEKMADYIIVHELCHLSEFNHSRKFWNLVAQAIPNYLEIKKQFKKMAIS